MTVLISMLVVFIGFRLSSFSAFSLSLMPPPPRCFPLHLWSHHCPCNLTLKVQFALRALQKDGTHRVQIVIAVTAQGPSTCLCDLEWTSRVTECETDALVWDRPCRVGSGRAKPADKVFCPESVAASCTLPVSRTMPGCHQADDKIADLSSTRTEPECRRSLCGTDFTKQL